jgi:hypothetical protein
MKKIETVIEIDATPERIWQVLTDFEDHPRWNPFIQSIEGEKVPGRKIAVFIKPPGSNGMVFRPVILKFNPCREFRWKGKLGITGIFDGEHYFILEPISDSQTRFIHGEQFSGILVKLMGNTLEKTREGFTLMNDALKQESEK